MCDFNHHYYGIRIGVSSLMQFKLVNDFIQSSMCNYFVNIVTSWLELEITTYLLWQCLYYINIPRIYVSILYVADSFQQLLMLEAQHGTPSQYTPAINQLIEYYKKVNQLAS